MAYNFLSLQEICSVNKNDDDRFVGIKINDNNVRIIFPLGYALPTNEKELRQDIRALLILLAKFKKKEGSINRENCSCNSKIEDFPILSFLDVLNSFIEKGGRYYTVTEKKFLSNSKGKIDFKKTIKKEKSFIKNNSIVYSKYQVSYNNQLSNSLITSIHKYCVFQAFSKFGWLYSSQLLLDPKIVLNKKLFLSELNKYYQNTNRDRDKRLFKSMIEMIEFISNKTGISSISYGVDKFENIWEEMIDEAFGIKNKKDYFPHAIWHLKYGLQKQSKAPLQPDSIMFYNGKIYILDAKFYKYGCTKNPDHLPGSADINKQITYGEYVKITKNTPSEKLYNAFLMPFNSQDKLFTNETEEANHSTCKNIINIGQAIGEWKTNYENYEQIQGILVDTRFLLLNYTKMSNNGKTLLSNAIENVLD